MSFSMKFNGSKEDVLKQLESSTQVVEGYDPKTGQPIVDKDTNKPKMTRTTDAQQLAVYELLKGQISQAPDGMRLEIMASGHANPDEGASVIRFMYSKDKG